MICPRLQEIGQVHGATVQASDHREYGEAIIKVLKQPAGSAPHMDKLFEGMSGEMPVSPPASPNASIRTDG
jgi:GMP synthase (glutamine-hydrolysing)